MAKRKIFVAMLLIATLLIVGGPTIKIKAAEQNPGAMTTLRGGNLEWSLKKDWLPMMQKLATGKAPGDKYTWTFEKSPLYAEAEDWLEAESLLYETRWALEEPLTLLDRVGGSPNGFFTVSRLYTGTKVEKIGAAYRAALVEYGVKEWTTPYGAPCSRAKALGFYNQCQKKIGMVVKKLKAARYKGKTLTKALKFKFIHDWLIASMNYDYKGLAKAEADPFGTFEKFQYLRNEFGPMVDGKAVCQGIAYAFKAICDDYNRRSSDKLVCDIAKDDEHSWNRVKINGQWYVIDVTFDERGKKDFVKKSTATDNFLVSDYEHGRIYYETCSGEKAKAKSTKYEGRTWPTFKKSLKECTVSLKYPNKVYKYKGKQVIPEVVVRYGKNVIPSVAYRVVRTDHKKTGVATFKVVPSKNCRLLKGSLAGPSFKIKKVKVKK